MNDGTQPTISFRQSLFWDTDPRKLDTEKNARYIIERVLDFGNDKEVKWLIKKYGTPTLKRVVARSRSLNPQTKSLWTLILKNK